MSASVVPFFRLSRRTRDWSAQELAEFYRVEAALLRAGLNIEIDRGLTDEGDPWFVFCRADDGEVVIHFARIGGMYLVAAPVYGGVTQGPNFGALVRDLIERHPMIGPRGEGKSNLIFHPAALLVVLVATAMFKTSEARAFTPGQDTPHNSLIPHTPSNSAVIASIPATDMVTPADAQHTGIVLSAVVIALASDPTTASPDTLSRASFIITPDASSQPWMLDYRVDVDGRGSLLDLQPAAYAPSGSLFGGLLGGQLDWKPAGPLIAALWNPSATGTQPSPAVETTLGAQEVSALGHDPALLPSLAQLSAFSPSTLDLVPVSLTASNGSVFAPHPIHAALIHTAPVVDAPADVSTSQVIDVHNSASGLLDGTAFQVLAETGFLSTLPTGDITNLPTATGSLDFVLQAGIHILVDTADASPLVQFEQVAPLNGQIASSSGSPETKDHPNPPLTVSPSDSPSFPAPTPIPSAPSDTPIVSSSTTPTSVPDTHTTPPTAPTINTDVQPTIPSSQSPLDLLNYSSLLGSATRASVENAMHVFEAGISHPALYIDDEAGSHSLIVVDMDAVAAVGISGTASVTFNFNDHTSIGLIGLPSEIEHVLPLLTFAH